MTDHNQTQPISVSLFDRLVAELDEKVPIITCTKTTLVHISHTLEDVVLKHNVPALLFTGFQESSHWRKETERYRSLAYVAQQVCIFAGKPLPEDSAASAIQVELHGDDPLRQEWFLLILSDRYSVLLCGKDNLDHTDDEGTRTFETIINFEAPVINSALDMLEIVLEEYRPDLLPDLCDFRQRYPLPGLQDTYVTRIIAEIIQFEERLLQQLTRMRTIQQLKDRLEVTLEKEQELGEVRKQLMNTISHEFRTPLASILTSTEMLERYLDQLSPEKRQERLNRVKEQVQHLTLMLNDISTVIYMDTGQMRYQPAPMHLKALCNKLISDIHLVSNTSHNIQLRYEGPVNTLYLDERLLRHIIYNLLSNAVKYSPIGSTIEFSVIQQNEQIVIQVEDEGRGIPEKDFDRLDEAFYRGSNAQNVPGTGMGLRIVSEAVTLHGGKFSYENRARGGANFTVRLPLIQPG